MAIALDAASDAGKTAAGTTLTWAHTCAGANRILIVHVVTPTQVTGVSSVTFNGDALTKIVERADLTNVRQSVWYRIAPDAATGNIVVTLGAAVACTAGASSSTGVLQTDPFGPFSTAVGTGTAPSVMIASALGELVHDFLGVSTTTATVSPSGGQTVRWDRLAAAVTSPRAAGSTKPGASLSQMDWTISASSQWMHFAINLHPALANLEVIIDDVDQTSRVRSEETRRTLQLHLTLGGDWTGDFQAFDTTTPAIGAYRPVIDESVLVRRLGARLFKGKIFNTGDAPWGGTNSGVLTDVGAKASSPITHQVVVEKVYPAGQTLLAVVQDLHATYFAAYGITLDPTMATGPTLDLLTFDKVSGAEALNYLSTITGWPWRQTPDDELQMFAVGDKVASFILDDTTAQGPVTWERTRGVYINRVTLRFGTESLVTKTWSVVGDGATDRWELEYQGAQTADGHLLSGFVTDSDLASDLPVGEVTVDPSAFWDYDAATNEMVRVFGDLPNLDTATMEYQTQFPQEITVEDAAEIAAHDVWAATFDAPDIFDRDEAIQFATGLLRRHITTPKRATVTTWGNFELPGSVVELDFPDRLLTGDFLIMEVNVTDVLDGDLEVTYTCLEGTETQQSWTDALKAAIGGGGSASTNGGTVTGGLIPGATGIFEGAVVAFNGDPEAEVRLGQYATGLSGGFGPGVQYGRGSAIDPGTWHTFAVVTGFYGGGDEAWNLSHQQDAAFGSVLQVRRTAAYTFTLLPMIGDGSAGGLGGYLGDPYNFTGLTGTARKWQAVAAHELFERGRAGASGKTASWTPTRTASAGTWTLGTVSGVTWQHGDIVYYRLNVENSTLSVNTNTVTVTLPFTSLAISHHAVTIFIGGVWCAASLDIGAGATTAVIERVADDAGVRPAITGGAGFYCRINFWHEIA